MWRPAISTGSGCFNVRDLGGLPAAGGRVTRRGAIVRADALDGLTAAGWRALAAHGVRTVVDLRGGEEHRAAAAGRPADVATIRVPLGRIGDPEVRRRWGDRPVFATPLYYRSFLDRFAGSTAAAIAAIAHARPGGVAFHCAGGRDRTGLIAILLLTLARRRPRRRRRRLRAQHRAPARAVRGARRARPAAGDRGVPARRGHDGRGRRARLPARRRRRRPPARRRPHGRRRRRPPRSRPRARDWLTATMATATATAFEAARSHRRGQVYVALAALAWSSAGVLQRGLSVDAATQVAVRAAFAGVALLAWVALQRARAGRRGVPLGRPRRRRIRRVRRGRVGLVHRRAQPHDRRARAVHPGDGAGARRAARLARARRAGEHADRGRDGRRARRRRR